MRSSLVAVAAFLSICSAQSTVVDLFLLSYDERGVAGSVVASDATATTYALACAPTATTIAPATTSASGFSNDNDDFGCGIPPNFSVTQGPSTVTYQYTASGQYTYSLDCKLAGTTSAFCTYSLSASGVSSIATTSATGSDIASVFVPVTITGLAQVKSTATGVTATATSGFTSSVTPASGASASSGSTSVAVAGASTTSILTGTAPSMTAKAGWLVVGAAAAVVVAF